MAAGLGCDEKDMNTLARTRAKLYVSALNLTANSAPEQDYDPENLVTAAAVVTMTPVYSSRPDAENHAFWSATPNGKLTLGLVGDFERYRPGTFWYVDLIEDTEGPLTVKTYDLSGDVDPESSAWGSMVVKLQDKDRSNWCVFTEFEMVVSNKKAWRGFAVGARYRIELTLAPKLGPGVWYEGKRIPVPALNVTGGYLKALLGIPEDAKLLSNGNRAWPIGDDELRAVGYDSVLTVDVE